MVLVNSLRNIPPEVYLLLVLTLAAIEWGIVIAGKKFHLGAPVTVQSVHRKFTPTGGGIIWVITGIAATLIFCDTSLLSTWIFATSIFVLGVISYIDDLHPLHPVPRLIVQIIVMAFSFKSLFYPQALDIYLLVLFCGVGIINAVNFLDGICGMLALYGIVVTASIIYAINLSGIYGMEQMTSILVMVIIAQVVFAIFNLRDTIFAGDVGSITLGYIQVYATITLILFTKDITYLIFFAVCIADTGLTTLQRLFSGVSILKPHRMNLYQLLTLEKGIPHIVVSIIYALLQLLIDALFFLIPVAQHGIFFIVVCALLIIAYFALRFSFKLQTH